MYVAKTKALICGFVFAYADCWFSYAAAQISAQGFPNFTPQHAKDIKQVISAFSSQSQDFLYNIIEPLRLLTKVEIASSSLE